MNNDITSICTKASEIILSLPKTDRIRVVSHYDADGITAASIICKALIRKGYDIHASLMRNPFDKGIKRISKEENQLIIFTDMGSGQIDQIENLKSKIIIIDHHQALREKTKDNVFQINANLCSINGNYEACGATLAYVLAKTLDENNADLVDLAITGATGDKQYIGGFKGLNKKIIDEAVERDLIKEEIRIKLSGENIFNALYFSIDPYYSGLSGNKEAIKKLLEKLNIGPEERTEKIKDDKLKQLQSYLMFILIKKGCEKNILDTVIRPRYKTNTFNLEMERFADLLDSCGKGGHRGIGLSTAMGDKKSYEKALEFEKEYKKRILDELLRLESQGFKEKKSYRYFYCKDSSAGGVIGGIATNFMLDNKKPLISIVKKDHELHVSCRGNQMLVEKGLDLGLAMKQIAEKLGGHGGGHAIASGATLSDDKEKEFLEILEKIINKQIK